MVYFYFAYGSNLLRQRLLCNQPVQKTLKGVAELKDYELQFKGFSCSWGGHPATIEEKPGSVVWGAVWELDDDTRPLLDRQESCYSPVKVTVTMDSGEAMDCLTYQMKTECIKDNTGSPSPHYLDVIQRGARQSGLPEDYRQWLQSVKHNNYSDNVPLYQQVLEQINNDPTCSDDL